MSSASSPLPSFPCHIAQSKPYDFLPAASAAGVAFTGLVSFDASGGILYSAAAPGAGAFCSCRAETAQHNRTRSETTRTAIRIGPPQCTRIKLGEGAFYSRGGNPAQSFFTRFHFCVARGIAGLREIGR